MPRKVTAKTIHVIEFNPDGSEKVTAVEKLQIKKADLTAAGVERRRDKATGKRKLYQVKQIACVQLQLFPNE